MKSIINLFLTILCLAIFDQTYSKSLHRDGSRYGELFEHTQNEHLDTYIPQEAYFKDFKYMTTISVAKHFNICAGTIIATRYVLTAADCVNQFGQEGSLFVRDPLSEAFVIVKQVYFSEILNERDQVAVLELKRPLHVQPISIISGYEINEAIQNQFNALTVGYLNTPVPIVAKVTLYPEEHCIENYRQMLTEADKYDFNENLHLCFYPMKNGFVSKFDGSPLVIDGQLAGIKIHNMEHKNNSLFCKITNFIEFLEPFVNEETPEGPSSNQCPELTILLDYLHEVFNSIFDRLDNLDYRLNNAGLLKHSSSGQFPFRRVSRNADYQIDSELVFEFEMSVQGFIGDETEIKEVVIQHDSKPHFSIKISEGRLKMRVEKDDSFYDPSIWFQHLNVIVTIIPTVGEPIHQDLVLTPIELVQVIFVHLFSFLLIFFPHLNSYLDSADADFSTPISLNNFRSNLFKGMP